MVDTRTAWERVRARTTFVRGFGDPCWLWTGPVDRDGYGKITVHGKSLRVHRVAYEEFVCPIFGDLTIDHLCKVRNCVNPLHMQQVTAAENARRAARDRVPKEFCCHGDRKRVTASGNRYCPTCQKIGRKVRQVRLASSPRCA